MDNSGKERLADTLVPKIGRYSNTQNRIRMSDLNANDYPHPELHKISLNTPVKSPKGGHYCHIGSMRIHEANGMN